MQLRWFCCCRQLVFLCGDVFFLFRLFVCSPNMVRTGLVLLLLVVVACVVGAFPLPHSPTDD